MKLSKLMKLSACAICLGSFVMGMSAMATDSEGSSSESEEYDLKEYKYEYDSETGSGVRVLFESKISDDSPEKLKEKNEIYNKEMAEGKSKLYAEHYSFLIVYRELSEEKARRIADVYEKTVISGKDVEYAKYYAHLIVEEYVKEEIAEKEAATYKELIESNKDQHYAIYYAFLKEREGLKRGQLMSLMESFERSIKKGNSPIYSEFYAYCEVNNKFSEKYRDLKSKFYERKINQGASRYYAGIYAYRILGKGSLGYPYTEPYLFERLKLMGKSTIYASKRASSMWLAGNILESDSDSDSDIEERVRMLETCPNAYYEIIYDDFYFDYGFSEEKARLATELYYSSKDKFARKELIKECKGKDKKRAEAIKKEDEKRTKLYVSFIVKHDLNEYSAMEMLRRYESVLSKAEYKKKELNEKYAKYYTELVTLRKIDPAIADNQAKVFVNYLNFNSYRESSRRCLKEADFFASSVTGMNLKEEEIKKAMEICNKEISMGLPFPYAFCYAKLIIGSVPENEARIRASKYMALIRKNEKSNSDFHYLNRCAELLEEGYFSQGEIDRILTLYMEELKKNNDLAAKFYSYIIVKENIDKTLAKKLGNLYASLIYKDKFSKESAEYGISTLMRNRNFDYKKTVNYLKRYEELLKAGYTKEYTGYFVALAIETGCNVDELRLEFNKNLERSKRLDQAFICTYLSLYKKMDETLARSISQDVDLLAKKDPYKILDIISKMGEVEELQPPAKKIKEF